MENVKEAIEGTLEDVNEAIVEIANDFNDFAGEFSFSDLLDVGKTVGETLEMVGTKLNKMQEAEMEEMVEKVKPRLRRETFENSFMLNRVGRRQFLLLLLVIVQVMMMRNMLMLMLILTDALCSDDRDPADAWPALLPGRCSSCLAKACPCGGPWVRLAQVDPNHHPLRHPPGHPP